MKGERKLQRMSDRKGVLRTSEDREEGGRRGGGGGDGAEEGVTHVNEKQKKVGEEKETENEEYKLT